MLTRSRRHWLVLPCVSLAAIGHLADHSASAATTEGREAAAHSISNQAEASPPPALTAPDYSAADRDRRLGEKGVAAGSPVMIRIFKQESELELWMQKHGRFELFATYPICFWSGTLGPKRREGDKQAPEGFYSVDLSQLYPTGRRPRSFDIGFPNAFDRSFARTGSYIFVHGGCTSVGCFAMTNSIMDEIYALTERALREGQERIEVHAFPFRMTEANLAAQADNEWHSFWTSLKEAYDLFEQTHVPPRISTCGRRYIIRDGTLPPEHAPPPDNGSPTAFGICEDAIAGIVPMAGSTAEGGGKTAVRHRRVAQRPYRRHFAGRNVRANYAAARKARMAAYARRARATADSGARQSDE
jgi:murein L,D-transpeptidase YafK